MEELLQYLQSADIFWVWMPYEYGVFLLIMFCFVIVYFYHDPVAGNDAIWRA